MTLIKKFALLAVLVVCLFSCIRKGKERIRRKRYPGSGNKAKRNQ